MKRQVKDCKTTFLHHISGKGLVSGILNDLSKLNSKTKQNKKTEEKQHSNRKCIKDMNTQFTKENIQMANMKHIYHLLAIWAKESKTVMRYHSPPSTRTAKNKSININQKTQ